MLGYLDSFHLSTLDWVLLILGALFVGMSKGGLPGTGGISVWIYVKVFGAKESVGMLLPVLICADIYAVIVYHRHADLKAVWRMFPYLLAGALAGTLIFTLLPGAFYQHFIGGVLLLLVIVHFFSKKDAKHEKDGIGLGGRGESTVSLFTGVFSMLANAGSVLMAAYLIRKSPPKLVFLGTFAWIITLSNLICLPLHYAIESVTLGSLPLGFGLGVLTLIGVVIARLAVPFIPQKQFEYFIWSVIVLAGLELLL